MIYIIFLAIKLSAHIIIILVITALSCLIGIYLTTTPMRDAGFAEYQYFELDLKFTWGRAFASNIPTMQFFTGICRNTKSKSYMLSLTGCFLEFQNNVLSRCYYFGDLAMVLQ